MGIEDDIAFFEQTPILASLGKQALRVLAIGAETRQLASGAVLFYAGERADGGYMVLQGSLVLESESAQGREQVVGPGTLLNELALFADTTSPVTAIAREPAVLIRISRGLFRKVLEGYPAAALRLRDAMAGRLGDWQQDLTQVKKRLEGGN